MMNCHGKCYLSKKLKEQEQNQTPASTNDKFEILPFIMPVTVAIFSESDLQKVKHLTVDETTVFSFHSAIFHPPTA